MNVIDLVNLIVQRNLFEKKNLYQLMGEKKIKLEVVKEIFNVVVDLICCFI